MRIALLMLAMLAWLRPLSGMAGERCIAIDGDTLVCNHQKVRLTNVYAAELNEPGGRAAKRRLQGLVTSGEVALRALGQDRYGRTLAEVYVNGKRIEQADIGPRAGRGARWRGDRHRLAHIRKARYPGVRAYRVSTLKNIPRFLA